jgi:tRNA A37 threonylcarbamoyladenosine biosynthesis protein TsaE
MAELPELEPDYKKFINYSTLILGDSNAGKSTLITDILYQLKPHVEQIVVFCPTDRLNHTYDSIVPRPLIHYDISTETIKKLWERQEVHVEMYNRAQNPVIIERLFNKVARGDRVARDIIARFDEKAKESGSKEIRARVEEFKMMVWKRVINNNRHRYDPKFLTADELHTLKYLDFNPHIVMIFDDCTDQLNKVCKDNYMKKAFYAGRHNKVTFIIACHDDLVIPKTLRDGVFVTFYMKEKFARNVLMRNTTKLGAELRKELNDVIKSAFTPMAEWQKLVYTKNDGKFWRFTATLRKNFTFCSPTVWKFCEAIEADPRDSIKNSVYAKNFT